MEAHPIERKMCKSAMFNSCLVIIPIAALQLCSTVLGQQFRSVPTTVKTYENETVLLPCYHNSPYRYVRWSRDDLLLTDSRYPDLTPPPRVQLWKNGSLEVSQVQTEDTGDYTCEIITEGGRALQHHAIEVQFPPILSMYPTGDIEVRVGQILEVICDATGVPTPFITWDFKDANVTYENKRHLTILVEDKDFAGPVECAATNGVGEEARAALNVIVHYEPEVSAKTSIVHTKNGQLAQLECTVNSVPPATMHWFHNNLPLSTDRRYSKQDNPVSENIHRHILSIRNVKDGDLGQYECKAENKVGIRGAHIELTGRPMTVSFKPSTELTSPNKHNLIWQVESFSPVIEYKLKFRKIPSGDITPNKRYPNVAWSELIIPSDGSAGQLHSTGYTLQGLQSASVYEVVVLARNRYGWSESSNILRFATGGEIQLDNNGFQTTEIVDYTEENEDPYITDNVITKDFYDYSEFQIASSDSNKQSCKKVLAVICTILYFTHIR
ncbi:hemicentin-2 [Uranotaenia lowii]|uniref:hemicentin-2 n=1 Tax=Uranotaenia lowii TaxID=190385 RepID=UPI002478671B|nr:hemicentin-2 [Uranotaenia lowii]XP_055593148.1 hemicentin-2 [Uranotaenia lowii]